MFLVISRDPLNPPRDPWFLRHAMRHASAPRICQADQRLTERSHMTQWLMKPFARGLCLRIHVAPRWSVGGGWGGGKVPGLVNCLVVTGT